MLVMRKAPLYAEHLAAIAHVATLPSGQDTGASGKDPECFLGEKPHPEVPWGQVGLAGPEARVLLRP